MCISQTEKKRNDCFIYAALRAPAAAMSMSHAHGSMTQLNKYHTVFNPPAEKARTV